MTNQKCAVIISGFPGVGKTVLHEERHDGQCFNDQGRYTIYDVETIASDPQSRGYWQTAEELTQKEDAVVLVVASEYSHRMMLSLGWRFVCVYPSLDLKDESLKRYFDRNGPDATWNVMGRDWEEKIEELDVGYNEACTDLELMAGEFLADVLRDILAGVEDGTLF